MRVVVAGGHGRIALLLQRLLADGGHEPVGIIRNPHHSAEVHEAGGAAIVLDLEHTSVDVLADRLAGADAVVFAAGAGPNSGAPRKLTVDRDAAILLADAAQAAGVRRYLMVSAISADDHDPESDDVFQIYLRAKSEADAYVRASGLDWTVIRPGGLTDEQGTGRVEIAVSTGRGTVPRADVAAVLAYLLETGAAVGKQFELIGGSREIGEAVAGL